MTHMDKCRPLGPYLAAGFFGVLTCAWTALALAQSPAANPEPPANVISSDQILQGLKPQPQAAPTRSLSFAPADKTRNLVRKQDSVSQPSVNLNVPFEYNSSALKPQANAQLEQLEQALASPQIGNERFVVAGHTDAKGSAEYNKQLSLRRAETVKHFLVQKGIDPKRLETIGYGSERPLSPDHPEDPSNRRVEIRTIVAE
jgi:outer membrane protein OmpA-like peptidoglycan-associated protein